MMDIMQILQRGEVIMHDVFLLKVWETTFNSGSSSSMLRKANLPNL